MTDAARGDRPAQLPDRWKLYVLIGAAALLYEAALTPVLASVRQIAQQDAQRQALWRQVLRLQAQTRTAAAHLRKEDAQLRRDLEAEAALRAEIARLASQTPPAPPALPTYAGVPLPPVHATTGASGVP